MKLPINVMNFTAGNAEREDAYKKFVEYYSLYKSGKTANEQGVTLSEMNDKMLLFYSDEIERMSGRKRADYADLKMYCNFTDVKESAFAIVSMLTDLIIPDALIKDLGMLAEIKNGGWGDTLKVEMKPRDLFIVAKGGRARRTYDIVRQYNGERTIVPEVHAITVGISLYDVLRGAYSLAEFVSKAVISVETSMRYDIYDAFAKAMDELPSTAGDGQLKVAGFTQDTAIALAQKIQAWNGGNKAVFVGTQLALSKILPASTNARILLGDEYVRVGYMREFMGFSTIALEQVADYTKEFAVKLDDKKIFVISPGTDKVVKVFVEGSTLSNTEADYANANLQQTSTLYKSYGVGAFTSAIAGEITLN
nr:MAG TPA: capsid protein [Caudoviricetes sp.]